MIYFSNNKQVQILESEGSYLMDDATAIASYNLCYGMFSGEVNIINYFRDNFTDTQGKCFIDIGANVGTYSVVLGHVFDKLYAFEPNIHNYNILCGNMALHNLSFKSKVYNIGLSDKTENLTYKFVDYTGGNNMFVKEDDQISEALSHMYDVYHDDMTHDEILPVTTLDSFNIKNIGLIKIDVEGFELNVIKGAEQTLINSNYPPMIIESWNVDDFDDDKVKKAKVDLRNNLFTYLNEHGYSIRNLERDVFYAEHNITTEQ